MTPQDKIILSYYDEISSLNDTNTVTLVQHRESKQTCVKKTLSIYNKSVYQYLKTNHIPNTPIILEIIEDENNLIVIEEYISGIELDIALENSKLTEKEINNYIKALCYIVNMLHSINTPIIHRDIKPANIIITPDQALYLLDFNTAKIENQEACRDTRLLGTPGFAAPEQYGFGSSSVQTDIYAIGKVLEAMLIASDISIVNYKAIIDKCTKLEPSERYQSTDEIVREINKINKRKISLLKYAPPGLRGFDPLVNIMSIFMYGLILYCSVSLKAEAATQKELLVEKIFVFIMLLGIVLIDGNYLKIQDKLPLVNNTNMLKKFIGIIIFDVLFAFCIVTILAIIINII